MQRLRHIIEHFNSERGVLIDVIHIIIFLEFKKCVIDQTDIPQTQIYPGLQKNEFFKPEESEFLKKRQSKDLANVTLN